MDFKLCISFTAILVVSYGQQPPQCVQDLMQNQEFMQCTQEIAKALTPGDVSSDGSNVDPTAIYSAMCSADGRNAIACMMKFSKTCPQLAESGMGGGMNFTEIDIQGGMDVFCEMMTGDCKQMQTCVSIMADPNNMPTGGDGPGRTPFTAVAQGLGFVCGPVKSMMDCLMNLASSCPNSFKKFEEASQNMMKSQSTPLTYDESKNIVKDHCEGFIAKKMCVSTELNSESFGKCYDAVQAESSGQQMSCKQFTAIKQCMKEALDETCGAASTSTMTAVSPLIMQNIPNNCDKPTGSAANLHASVVTALFAASVAFLYRL